MMAGNLGRTLTRRQFVRLAAAGAGAALAGCTAAQPAPVAPTPVPAATPTAIPPATPAPSPTPVPAQLPITQVELMPNIPQPFKMRDWRTVARKFDALAFDFEAQGDYLPLIWWDKTRINMARDGFGLPSYVGDTRQGAGNAHEGITCIAAVLGATLVGIDKTTQGGHDWVDMLEDYFNTANGLNLVLNGTSALTGRTFWYETYPAVEYCALASLYPQKARMAEIMRITADRWYDACVAMGGSDTSYPDFLYTAFDFAEMKPKFNGQWKEPDAAAGIAWLQYMAYQRFGDKKYLQAADWCMQFLHHVERNPLYEVLLPFGAYLAVRMNAEAGASYDAAKLINWCFDGSYYRYDWGVNIRRWGDYDCHGLASLRTMASGYAFAMNTFAWAGALAPIARYDTRYARAIGKWLLNLANNARLFYADALPADQQSSAFWQGDPEHVIAYEGLQEISDKGVRCYAAGDPLKMGWGKTDFGIYGSTHVGLLGSIVAPTEDEKILRLDLLATDFYHAAAYPTYLYYNPYDSPRTLTLDLGDRAGSIYDATNHRFALENASGPTRLDLPADTGVVLALTPPGGEASYKDNKLFINNVVVDYHIPAPA